MRWLSSLLFVHLSSLSIFAQKPFPPVEVTVLTADGVKLKGLFHASPGGAANNNAVVILMYQPGNGNSMKRPGKWGSLVKELVKAGFHVFQFDWRGHGESKYIIDPDTFWDNAKSYVRGGKKPVIDVRDFQPEYFPSYVQDLAAVRRHLDGMNDLGVLNTSSIYLIGERETASIGFLWMTAEWLRPASLPPGGAQLTIVPMTGRPITDRPAGMDIAGAVWLSAGRNLVVPESTMASWSVLAPRLRAENPMLFVYGAKDAKSASSGKFFYDRLLAGKGKKMLGFKPLEQTFLLDIKDSSSAGVDLLGQGSPSEDYSLKYLKARQTDRVTVVWRRRNYLAPYAIDLKQFGIAPIERSLPTKPDELLTPLTPTTVCPTDVQLHCKPCPSIDTGPTYQTRCRCRHRLFPRLFAR
jgi:hypothetical protein